MEKNDGDEFEKFTRSRPNTFPSSYIINTNMNIWINERMSELYIYMKYLRKVSTISSSIIYKVKLNFEKFEEKYKNGDLLNMNWKTQDKNKWNYLLYTQLPGTYQYVPQSSWRTLKNMWNIAEFNNQREKRGKLMKTRINESWRDSISNFYSS